MAYDKQLETKFRFFQQRILELEKAAAAQDRALEQLAEKAGVEIDLTHSSTTKELAAPEHEENSARRPREDREVMDLLREAEQDEAQ